MRENFTQGPWQVVFSDDDPYGDIEIKSGKFHIIAKLNLDDAPVHDFNSEQEANARLMAAAPDMYYEIKSMCRAELELGTCLPSDCDHCQMNKVLKKARGKQ